ncbi:GxxExxY protein [Lewinella cohaerens]|uniref:GxxExxY protein n=1 Tax=Lewinella cohaerens TaxID=70995 RepID=UPI0003806C58|nr:GxxExxY protein [Lewinella cohaerens]
MLTKSYLKNLVYQVNGAAIEVHKALGPGLLESSYQKCLEHELKLRKIPFVSQKPISVDYKGETLELDFRCDLLVADCLVIELKAIEKILPIHKAQLMTYLRLLELPEGLMLNFYVTHLYKEGQKTYVTQSYRNLPD